MSNCAGIKGTIFTDIHTGDLSYGYRIYDDYGQSYNNRLNEDQIKNDMVLLEQVCHNLEDTVAAGIIDCMIEDNYGITINGNYYDYEEIKDQLNEFMGN